MYGEPEYYGTGDEEHRVQEAEEIPQSEELPRRRQPRVGEGGHVDSNPSPMMGGNEIDTIDEIPFIADPKRMAQLAAKSPNGSSDWNPSPTTGERRHEATLLDDSPGVAREDDPKYRLPKLANVPGGNALIEHYIEAAISALGNGDKVGAAQQVSAAKTLVMMVRVQAEKTKNQPTLQKMDNYLKSVSQIETTINS